MVAITAIGARDDHSARGGSALHARLTAPPPSRTCTTAPATSSGDCTVALNASSP